MLKLFRHFIAQGSRVIILVVVQAGAVVKIYVTIAEALRKKGKKTRWNSVYHQNWWKKLVWVPVISFCKFSFPVMGLMPYYYAGRSRPLIV